MKSIKSESHQMMTHGNIQTDHWSDGSMYLLLIVPPHRYLREQLRANDIWTRGQDLLIRIKSSGIELSYQNDSTIMISQLSKQQNSRRSLVFQKLIKASSWIRARDNMWRLPSSNVIDHMMIYTSDHLGLGSGGQLLWQFNQPPTLTLHRPYEHSMPIHN